MKLKKRIVRRGEALAMWAENLRTGPEAMWWDYWTPIPRNERVGDVAVVHVRGSLDHHLGFGCDSYEGIVERVALALDGGDDVDADDTDEVVASSPPKAVILRIDSPGGVVSGLNQAVFALRKLSKEAGIPLYAYVDELAASAAYAISCACEEIILPPAAICGSVGVISMMYDQTKLDAASGLKFVTITSGKRKADGHPHVAISDEAVASEQRRVQKLAKQFFRLVADVRPISKQDAEDLQAAIFVGNEAVNAGLADGVMGWDEMLGAVGALDAKKKSLAQYTNNGSGSSTRAATYQLVGRASQTESHMLLKLIAHGKRLEKALADETNKKTKAELKSAIIANTSQISAYKKTKHMIEKHETEEGDEDEDEESEESESEEEESAKGNETNRKEGDDDDEDDDSDDDDDEDGDAKKAKALARDALGGGAKGRRAIGKLVALVSKSDKLDEALNDIVELKAITKTSAKMALIDEKLAKRHITRTMADKLRPKSLNYVQGHLEMYDKPMVNIDEEALLQPTNTPNADLPKAVRKQIDDAVISYNGDEPAKEKYRASLINAHRERMAQTNGAGEGM